MPSSDITKCVNGCAKQATCHRWLAKEKPLQSYGDFKPQEGQCKYYWEVRSWGVEPSSPHP